MRPGRAPGDDPFVPTSRITEDVPMLTLTVRPVHPAAAPIGGPTP
jgi:hypothetical protein